MLVSWPTLLADIQACQRCALHRGITNKVPGQGNVHARLMLIGEGPGYNEDKQGLAFVGAAGQLLTRMLSAIDLAREDVYIANVVKCRPPENRTPTEEEAATCLAHLRAQVALIRPQVLLLLGATALRAVGDPSGRITAMRGKWLHRKGVWMLPTYHPAALLHDESKKKDAWHDLQLVQAKLKELEQQDAE